MNAIDDSWRVDRIRTALEEADAILIGAGAGLSAAAGLLYLDSGTFNRWFPGYHERYGLRCICEAAFFPFPTPEEFYAYWARHISAIRFRHPPGKPYLDLHSVVKGRNHFVLTTNVDGQFVKAGFDPARVCTPQGDYGFFQCAAPCSDDLYPNESTILTMLGALTEGRFAIPGELIPRCPRCGGYLEPNIRKGAHFVEAPWLARYKDLERFLEESRSGKLLLLEFGVGFNTPTIIRFPFERMAQQWENASLLRVNREEAEIGETERIQTFSMDAGVWIAALANPPGETD